MTDQFDREHWGWMTRAVRLERAVEHDGFPEEEPLDDAALRWYREQWEEAIAAQDALERAECG